MVLSAGSDRLHHLLSPTNRDLVLLRVTRGTLFEWEWIGFENFKQFFREPALKNGLRNTVIYAFVTSSLKVVLDACWRFC